MKLQQQNVLSTIVGSYPKPAYILPGGDARTLINGSGRAFYDLEQELGVKEFETRLDKACSEAITDQNSSGIDIVTDGEERREHYILYNLRKLGGIDFTDWQEIAIREGAYKRMAPKVKGKIAFQKSWLVDEFLFTKKQTDRIVKVTIPGPTTATDIIFDEYYNGDREQMAFDFAAAIRQEVANLIEAGCTYIQFDDPALLRNPERAQQWGLRALEACFAGLEDKATYCVHVCRGYPNKPLEKSGVEYKANANYYEKILHFLSQSTIDQVSIEGAQSKLDLSVLPAIGEKTIVLGVVDVGIEAVESVEQLVKRGKEALKYIKPNQLILAPDCGMIMISRDAAYQKLSHLSQAAALLNK
jgi:5-methyltetrahydropteroyltriglutamate--homocysteine methyltransferase